MSVLLHAFAALLLLASAVIALAPATLLDSRVAQATSGMLRVVDASGTVWQGRGTLTNKGGTFVVPLGWTLDPLPLLTGEVLLRLDPRQAGAPVGEVRYHHPQWRIERFAATLPATLVSANATANGSVVPGGDIRVELPRVEVGPSRYDGSGAIRWRGATLSFPTSPPVALGDVDIALAPSAGSIVGTVANRGGDVQLAGTVRADPVQTSLDLLLTPTSELRPDVARILASLGRGEGSGTRVQWQGPPLAP